MKTHNLKTCIWPEVFLTFLTEHFCSEVLMIAHRRHVQLAYENSVGRDASEKDLSKSTVYYILSIPIQYTALKMQKGAKNA